MVVRRVGVKNRIARRMERKEQVNIFKQRWESVTENDFSGKFN